MNGGGYHRALRKENKPLVMPARRCTRHWSPPSCPQQSGKVVIIPFYTGGIWDLRRLPSFSQQIFTQFSLCQILSPTQVHGAAKWVSWIRSLPGFKPLTLSCLIWCLKKIRDFFLRVITKWWGCQVYQNKIDSRTKLCILSVKGKVYSDGPPPSQHLQGWAQSK